MLCLELIQTIILRSEIYILSSSKIRLINLDI